MSLLDALRQENVTTENGMATNSSSLNAVVDLFYNIGAMRGQDKERLISQFSLAFATDSNRAMKILFWVRDVRGGAGERQIFRDIMSYLAKNYKDSLAKNLQYISEYGRWDDLLVLAGTDLQHEAFSLISDAIKAGDGLAAKWMPRKGVIAAKLRNHMDMSPKEYRKTLVELTSVVETLMCAKKWEDIDFSKLPSVASARYQKAFWKNAKDSYEMYVNRLQKGETKINAGALYPYDVIKSLTHGDRRVATEQWKALPNFLENADEMILPMVDTSGSMTCPAGGNPNVTCMDVALSLGLYISERNEGKFKDAFLTFSGSPALQYLKGDLGQRYEQLRRSDWAMNTNIEAAFKLILDQGVKHKVPQNEMPDKILILSDMQFDSAISTKSYGWTRNDNMTEWNLTAQKMIEKMYTDAGYKTPKIVYWNIQSRNGDVPVAFDKAGTALISGFSPAILTSLLGGKSFSPVAIMDDTILSARYEKITA